MTVAPLSLDLDNKWSYLKTHGDESWRELPSYLDLVVPRILSVLAERGLTITVFVVGQDAARPENREAIAAVAAAGHEIGNHSFHHEPWLHLYEPQQVADELARAEEAIESATGMRPAGFRGPGFSLSTETVERLAQRGYLYDATIFPNALNPVGRAYYFMQSNLSREERRQRKALFGTMRDAFRPNRPFRWEVAEGSLAEIPVTTMPGLRLPFHFSYLIWLAGRSEALAERYLRTALWLCRRTGNAPSLLLHPLDFLGVDDEPDLGFFPGMSLKSTRKLELVARFIDVLAGSFDLVPIGVHVAGLSGLDEVRPSFRDR
jgi:hypothetical protein